MAQIRASVLMGTLGVYGSDKKPHHGAAKPLPGLVCAAGMGRVAFACPDGTGVWSAQKS